MEGSGLKEANYPNPVRLAEFARLKNAVGIFLDIAKSEGDGAVGCLPRMFRAHVAAGKCVSAALLVLKSKRRSISGIILS